MKNSNYLKNLYLDVDDRIDLDLNFFNIQNTNKWESDSLYVVKAAGRNVMKYENEDEELEFQIFSSRMLKHGSVNNFEDAQHKTLQLYALEGANHNSKYVSKRKPSIKSNGVSISTIVEELDDKLIPLVRPLPRGLLSEEKAELEAIARPKHRDMSSSKSEKSSKETVCDSSYAQHVRNRAFSSNVSKSALVLPSDYNIPELEHLSAFAATALSIENDSEKLYASIFILLVSFGCLFDDLLNMLNEEKGALFSLKNGIMTTKIDNTLFAKDINELLESSEHEISFNLPILMNMLVVKAKFFIEHSSKTTNELFDGFKLYLKNAVNHFGSEISLKPKQLYRTMKCYTKNNASDLLSGCLTSGVYSKGEKAKLSYTSVRSSSANHSQIISSLWIDLGLDAAARKIIGLNGDLFTTQSVEIPEVTYAGSSNCAKAGSSREFSDTIESTIATYDIKSNEAFNLATIGVRFAMNLLLGTRNFNNSANFESASFSEAMMMVNEKASTVPAGIRVIPMCPTITSLMEAYYEDFLQPRGLDKNIWLIDNGKPTLYSSKKAYSILSKMPNINNKAILEQYVKDVPLNTGRHCFTKKAIELGISTQYISAYMGHYFAGAEQLGIYSTMDVISYSKAVKNVTSQIAFEHGIKDRLW